MEKRQREQAEGRQGAYLPVQKGRDQAKVLWVLHEPVEVRERRLVWMSHTPCSSGCHVLCACSSKASTSRDFRA